MLASKTKAPTIEEHTSTQTANGSGAVKIDGKSGPRKRGNLAATLDPLLDPRLSPGRPGRPNGVRNYEWTPEIDNLLRELCASRGPANAKYIVGKKIQESRPAGMEPRPDSVRKAVEYHMAKLGLSTGRTRKKPEPRRAKRWTEAETTALLGALGADATIKTIAARTGHTVKSVRAKLARLEYQVNEIYGFAEFTVDELAGRFHVTPRQIRRWKEKGWLQTRNRRITEPCFESFLLEHADQIPFTSLPREEQIYLIELGYPCPEGKVFRQNVREILDGIGRQRKPRRPAPQLRINETTTGDNGLDHDGSDNPGHAAGQSA
ncbi:MAG: hypothetical protein U0Q18_32765 [Bryobacteraceae bacterium]